MKLNAVLTLYKRGNDEYKRLCANKSERKNVVIPPE
jgi:hypothetical protein